MTFEDRSSRMNELRAELQTLADAQEKAVLGLLDAAATATEAVASDKFPGRPNVSHAARALLDDLAAARARYARALEVAK